MSLTRQVIGGAGLITLAGAAGRLLTLVSVPILSHLLGPGPYGVAALATSIMSLGGVMAMLGIDMAYARFFLQVEEGERSSVESFCWRFAAAGAFVLALTVGLGWYWLGRRWLPLDYRAVAFLSFFGIILLVGVTMASARARLAGSYRKLAVVVLIAAAVSVAVSLGVAMYWRKDVWPLLLGTLAGSATTVALLGVPRKPVLLKRSGLSSETRRAVISLGLAGTVMAPMYWVISSADRWFLAEYSDSAVIGIYAMASNVALLGLMLNSSLTLTWFPEASRLYGKHSSAALVPLGRLWERLVMGQAIVWVAVSAAGGDVLRLLTAPEFHQGAAYIPWLAGGVFFYGFAGFANTAFFLEGRMRNVAHFWLAGGAINLLMNLLLVPRLSALGAAIAQCATYGLIALGVFTASRRVLVMPVDWLRLSSGLLLALGAGILMSYAWSPSPVLSLLGKFPIGVLVALFLTLLIAPDWFKRALGGLRKQS